jgi:hypothetical protein
VKGRTLTFGISGYLYRSAVLYHDSETETFWSQMTGRAVVGPLTGEGLAWIPTETTTWKRWRDAHPLTTVLSPPLPMREYERDLYRHYRKASTPNFPTGPGRIDPSFGQRDLVTLVVVEGRARCWPHRLLEEGMLRDGDFRVERRGASVRVLDAEGKPLPSMTAFWFAWCVFYPDGTVWRPP